MRVGLGSCHLVASYGRISRQCYSQPAGAPLTTVCRQLLANSGNCHLSRLKQVMPPAATVPPCAPPAAQACYSSVTCHPHGSSSCSRCPVQQRPDVPLHAAHCAHDTIHPICVSLLAPSAAQCTAPAADDCAHSSTYSSHIHMPIVATTQALCTSALYTRLCCSAPIAVGSIHQHVLLACQSVVVQICTAAVVRCSFTPLHHPRHTYGRRHRYGTRCCCGRLRAAAGQQQCWGR